MIEMKDFFDWFEEAYHKDKLMALNQVIQYYENAPEISKFKLASAAIQQYNIHEAFKSKSNEEKDISEVISKLCQKYYLLAGFVKIKEYDSAEDLVKSVTRVLMRLPNEYPIGNYPAFTLSAINTLDPQFFVYMLMGGLCSGITGSNRQKFVNILASVAQWVSENTPCSITMRDVPEYGLSDNKAYTVGHNLFTVTADYSYQGKTMKSVHPDISTALFTAQLIKLSYICNYSMKGLPSIKAKSTEWDEIVELVLTHISDYDSIKEEMIRETLLLFSVTPIAEEVEVLYALLGLACCSVRARDIRVKLDAVSTILYWMIVTRNYGILCKDTINLEYLETAAWEQFRDRGKENFYILTT